MAQLDDREAFERELSRPPHGARMMERASWYVQRLNRADKDAFLETAVEHLWETRALIKQGKDVLTVWVAALDYAARKRPRWRVWFNGYQCEWIKGSRLGRV